MVASKGWKVQVKKLETNLVNLGSKPNEKRFNKNLIDEKDKLIESLQKKLEKVLLLIILRLRRSW